MKLAIRPLTPDLWPALEDLFGKTGARNGCWCMYGRIGAAYRKRPREQNKKDFWKVVEAGPPPACSPSMASSPSAGASSPPRRRAGAGPDLAAQARRRQAGVVAFLPLCAEGLSPKGVTGALILAALKAAKRSKAPALEAYPFDAAVSPSASGTGYASTFARLGFEVVARYVPARPIMRHDLKRL